METVPDGMTSTYSCSTGYTLVGAKTRICGTDGSGWSGTDPTCGNVLHKISHVRKPVLPYLINKATDQPEHLHCLISAITDINSNMSLVVRKLTFCICENKDADQLCGNREADQRLCFRYMDSTIPLLPKSEISSL